MATIEYNGYTGLTSVKIDGWHTEAVLAEDGMSVQSHKHSLSGTALISGTPDDGGTFKTNLIQAMAKLSRPRGNLKIMLGATTIVDQTGTDEFGGPICSFRPQQVSARHGIVSFDVTYWITDKITGETVQGDVLSHRWVQEWELGPDMMMVHRVAGALRVRYNAADTSVGQSANPVGSIYAVGRNPDAYRGLVVPPIPPGFRRERMRFGEDESGNELIYTVEDREYARDIPAPALTGDGTSTFTRDFGGGSNFLGIKVFDVELAAPTEVPVKDLLVAAVNVSKRRIKWSAAQGGPGPPDLVIQIVVEERGLFSDNRIRFRVTAQAMAMVAGSQGGPINPPNFEVFSNLLGAVKGPPGGGLPALAGYSDPGVYGTGGRLARSVRRLLYQSTSTAIPAVPRAQHHHGAQSPTPDALVNVVPTVEYVSPVAIADFTGAQDTIPDGTEKVADVGDGPWLYMHASDRVLVEDTGMRWLRSHRVAGRDLAIQMHKPRVYLVSEFQGARLNVPVHRPIRQQIPPGSILLQDRFEPTVGRVDANGQRAYMARHVRVIELAHASNADHSWGTPAPGNPMTFWPGSSGNLTPGHIQMAVDPTIQGQDVESHALASVEGYMYAVGFPEQYLA